MHLHAEYLESKTSVKSYQALRKKLRLKNSVWFKLEPKKCKHLLQMKEFSLVKSH